MAPPRLVGRPRRTTSTSTSRSPRRPRRRSSTRSSSPTCPGLWAATPYRPAGHLEPITRLAAIAARTERIGLIATASTTFYDPYNLARLFSSLDILSRGRAGWNIVTTQSDAVARNFSLKELPSA